MTLRVAAYCRVSTDKDDQLHSLSAQQAFFETYIAEHPDWESAGVYADELSGTSVRRRPQFSEMLRLALTGEIDLIVTKEVSRFARNTVDALQVTRQLKARGVGVVFLNDNIDTRDNDGEFRLTIMASVAQEESRKISERTRWGQRQAMLRGVVFGNDSLYGYTVRNGQLSVNTEQAGVVRLIYRKFLTERKGVRAIARELTEAGVRPPLRPEGAWSSEMVRKVLKNEKYCGDLLQKKYRTVDYLSHRKVRNDGAEEQIFLRDHHEAVVRREEFDAVQEELARRAGETGEPRRYSARYWFSGKIRCGNCGRSFAVKRVKRAGGWEYQRFVCRGRLEGECRMRAVRSELVLACARHVLRSLLPDRDRLAAELLRELRQDGGGDAEAVRQSLRRQSDRRERAVAAYLDGDLSREELRRLTARCGEETTRLRAQLERMRNAAAPDLGCVRACLDREIDGGEAVLEEAVRAVTVYNDCFAVEIESVPVTFLVWAEGSGTGKDFRVNVTECAVAAYI